jgi:NTP pyrophosphatase (non-canonical NTP hydrolase)
VKRNGTTTDTRDELLDLLMDVIINIKELQDALRRGTRHVFTRVEKCIDVDGGIFENVLY